MDPVEKKVMVKILILLVPLGVVVAELVLLGVVVVDLTLTGFDDTW